MFFRSDLANNVSEVPVSVRLVRCSDRAVGSKRNESVIPAGWCSAPSLWALSGYKVGSLKLLPYASSPAWEVGGIHFFYVEIAGGQQQQEIEGGFLVALGFFFSVYFSSL